MTTKKAGTIMPQSNRRQMREAQRRARKYLAKLRCFRCGKRFDGTAWITQYGNNGRPDHVFCDGCSTPADVAEALAFDAKYRPVIAEVTETEGVVPLLYRRVT
ncbi:hypothetical protein [Rhodococcus artemisiae]|uniref:HNH endonuclease n=1 Tax=Rhodococcus artemisiae TaxID=714159 RepID=A0ABU7L4X7_9NOCA|nr:hypothetical protein [Rhodococcus artemisiae]MEE2056600.1 hypothetical protein [Rhodococcus artemisiae]